MLSGQDTHIQKHHRQLAWEVEAPPKTGLKLADIPKQLTTKPM